MGKKLDIIKEAIQDNQKTMRDQARGLFHYHDDMVNSPSHLGAEFPHIHETLRKQAAERYRNLTGGKGTLTSRHTKEVYPNPELKTESTAPKRTYKDEEDRLNAWADKLDGMSALQAVARFPDVKNPQHAIRAHRNQIEDLRNKSWEARRKHLAGHIIEAKKEEDEEPKTSSAEPKAHHWNNAKRAYGVPLTVKYQNIGGTAVDKNGKRVSRKELVRKHAYAAANAASKYSPEEKAAWRSKLIAQRTAEKKAREAT